MAENTKPSDGEHCCAICGTKSDERVLLAAEQNGKPVWVCVHCLPALIHGGH